MSSFSPFERRGSMSFETCQRKSGVTSDNSGPRSGWWGVRVKGCAPRDCRDQGLCPTRWVAAIGYRRSVGIFDLRSSIHDRFTGGRASRLINDRTLAGRRDVGGPGEELRGLLFLRRRRPGSGFGGAWARASRLAPGKRQQAARSPWEGRLEISDFRLGSEKREETQGW
jgi:hypothetical protein